MDSPFRLYESDECGPDGYPTVWHKNGIHGELDALIEDVLRNRGVKVISDLDLTAGIKHIVRQQAEHRCLRCRHPFIVGQSGELEGPQHQSKALAAEIGVNSETLDLAIEDDIEILPPGALLKAPRTNWSDCDGECRHGGPVRFRLKGTDAWGELSAENFSGQWTMAENGIGDDYEFQAAWRILTVHHLNEVKRDLRWWNLVALCQRCHLLIQRKVTMEDPWPWEHTDWFRPYAAAWYAQRYLGQDLDRDETMDRLDMLLELGKQEESIERMPI